MLGSVGRIPPETAAGKHPLHGQLPACLRIADPFLGRALLTIAGGIDPADEDSDIRPTGGGVVRMKYDRTARLEADRQQAGVEKPGRATCGHHRLVLFGSLRTGKDFDRPFSQRHNTPDNHLPTGGVDPDCMVGRQPPKTGVGIGVGSGGRGLSADALTGSGWGVSRNLPRGRIRQPGGDPGHSREQDHSEASQQRLRSTQHGRGSKTGRERGCCVEAPLRYRRGSRSAKSPGWHRESLPAGLPTPDVPTRQKSMATDTRLSKERSHKPSKQPRKHASAADPAPVSAVDRQPEAAAATRPVGAEPSAGPPSPPRVRRTEAGRRIRRIAAVTETLTARDHLIQLAEQVQAGANNPQRTRFIESAIGECLEDAANNLAADRWLAAEGATWALGWMARARRAGGSAGGLLESLVREARTAREMLSLGDTGSARFVLTLARLFSDIEACRCLEAAATDAVSAEIDRLVSPQGVVNVANGSEMVRRAVRWTTCREVAAATGTAMWSEPQEQRWREAATAAVRLLGRQGRQIEAAGLMPLCFTAPLLDAVAAIDGRLSRTVEALRKAGRPAKQSTRCIRLAVNDATAAVATLRTGWDAAAIRVLLDYRQSIPRIEIAAGDRMLFEGPWHWSLKVDDEQLEPEGPWTVACWEAGRKACYLEITAPLAGGRLFERTVVLLPQDRALLLADAVTTTDEPGSAAGEHTDTSPDTGWLRYASSLPLTTGLAAEPADETREILVFDTSMRLMALPLALGEWRVPARGSFTAVDGSLRLAQDSAGRRLYAPLWLDLDPARLGRPLTWRQLTVADTRLNLGPHQAAGFRVQAGLEQWLVYRSLDAPRNRTVLGCNVACDFLLGHIKPKGAIKRTLEIQ